MAKAKEKTKAETKYAPRCYESHPAYEVAPGKFIYGGSCGYPIVKDADVYGGFDWSMHKKEGNYPWSNKVGPTEFLFEITDMQAPKNEPEFAKMIEWLAEQVLAGKKVHIGCIGGHGRTGTVMAALRKFMVGDENATQHVRDHYCSKAVESQNQIDFLQQVWGIKPVKPGKTWAAGKVTTFDKYDFGTYSGDNWSSTNGSSTLQLVGGKGAERSKDVISTGPPLSTDGSIWA
jgi:hypothetical protein